MSLQKLLSPIVVTILLAAVAKPALAEPLTLYVAPDGDDRWSGRLAEPNADRTDGPLATPTAARDAVRRWRSQGAAGPATVYLRGGTYYLVQPLVFEPQDSATAEAPVVYAAYADEQPVLSGGRLVTGWRKADGPLWQVDLPEVKAGHWYFRQLFVSGRRATRARSPNQGYFRVEGLVGERPGVAWNKGVDKFRFRKGDLRPWQDLGNVEVIVFHSWNTSRVRIASVDEESSTVTFTGPTVFRPRAWDPEQRYYVENARELLDEPGEWYLDGRSGTLFYWPLPDEDLASAQVVAPVLSELVRFDGNPDEGKLVSQLRLAGLSLQHADWTLGPKGYGDPQAAVTVPAAVMADGARNCAIEGCEIARVGGYAIWLRRGSKHNRVVHNRIHDLGAGGVRIGEASMAPTDEAESSRNLVDNNHVFDGGHVYAAGVGVWVAQSSGNTISHNEIHDLDYSGMSIGWNWNDAANRCHHNTIELNHVHHVMRGVLSDGGAIYTLGTSPGSVIRNNVFHDVWPYQSPPFGWGIYLDATCSGYLVENNLVYNTRSGGLMYNNGGHEHVIRNNVFAFSADCMLWPYWEKRPNTFERNIVYLTQGELMSPLGQRSLGDRLAAGESLGAWDENLYWHTGGPDQIRFLGRNFAEWQELGLDRHSRIADPQFVDAAGYDFRLKPASPALELGFRQIDTTGVGLYGDAAWIEEARQVHHPKTVLPAPPPQ